MRKNLSQDELIALNAYLDGELPPTERAVLERQLEVDDALRGELDSLRETMGLLRMLEPAPVPRNFTLDPARYGQAARRGLSDWVLGRFPLAAFGALAAAILVFGGLILALNRGTGGAPAGVAMQAPAAAPAEMEAAADNAAEAEAFTLEANPTAAEEPAAEAPAAEVGAAALVPPPAQAAPEAAAAAAEMPAEEAPEMAVPADEAARVTPEEPPSAGALPAQEEAAEAHSAVSPRLAFVVGTVALALLVLGGLSLLLTRRR
ncbi:MAG: hypothetical protein IT326_09100 [Anaerolineae bacterium]|nr:hypothetical protein [Anaerolineae bacterium]